MPHPREFVMRRKSFLKMCSSLIVVLVAVGFADLAQAAVTTANSQAVQALKTAHALLATADHDYQGHRAVADQEVRKAMAALGYRYRKARTVSTVPAVAAPQPSMHKPQANSDAQLAQARQILQGVLAQAGASHRKAAAHLQAAIVHINAALSVK
jgi:thermostable 8-oxoguanine DNA glycosylase